MADLRTFFILVGMVYLGFTLGGLVLAPMLSIPRKLLSKYELRKVHLITDRIDGGVRAKVAGALSHPEEIEGKVSLADEASPEPPHLVG